jgi:hypothetical protein
VTAHVLTLEAVGRADVAALLEPYGLHLTTLDCADPIPGSYWGGCEAGLRGDKLYVRADTPVHSVLHEACHFICMSAPRRTGLDTDAGGDEAEECAVCYLQVLLADLLPAVGRDRLFADMDSWGYSFRLGGARDWFEQDAEDARQWLRAHDLTDCDDCPTGACRR